MANQYDNYDYTDIESKLKQRAQEKNLAYDSSDLEDIKRNASYTDASGNFTGTDPNAGLNAAYSKYDERANSQQSGGSQPQQSSNNRVGAAQSGGGDLTNQWLDYIKQRDAGVAAERAQQQQSRDALWKTYTDRANQSLNVDRNTPAIRQQADAYSANEQRAGREYLADTAEKSGPYANLRGEQRMVQEKIGQRTGTFESELVGRELQQRRDEISQALQSMSGLLTAEQQRGLQEQLGLLDAALGQQRIGLQAQGLDQDWQRALMQNNQFNSQLEFNAEDRAAYYDLIRRGLL